MELTPGLLVTCQLSIIRTSYSSQTAANEVI